MLERPFTGGKSGRIPVGFLPADESLPPTFLQAGLWQGSGLPNKGILRLEAALVTFVFFTVGFSTCPKMF